MQIPDEVKKCVAFVACRRNRSYAIGGTAFFVGYPAPDNEQVFFTYAVTARHVIEEIGQRTDGYVYLRVNTQQHGIEFVPIPIAEWVFSADSRVDVAVAPVAMAPNQLDHKFLPLTLFVTPKNIAEEELGIGDDLFFPGLFTHRPGRERNLPIVRIGNIAAMPEEPIQTKWGLLRPSYLVEARSIGGLSGSPVFWYRGAARMIAGDLQMGFGSFRLLGLVHGHFAEQDIRWDAHDATVADGANTTSINMGIAIVVPASDILATFDHSDLRRIRTRHQESKVIEELVLPITIIAEPMADLVTQEYAGSQSETVEPIPRDVPMTDSLAQQENLGMDERRIET